MADLDDIFKENVRKSFEKAKEDYSEIKNELDSHKILISKLNELLGLLTKKFEEFDSKLEKKEENEPIQKESSIGNEGVQSLTHSAITQQSLTHQSLTPSNKPNFAHIKQLENTFKGLTKQEFLIFLSIYQLEDDKGSSITYEDLKKHLKLSQSGVRSYTSILMKRGLPIEKVLFNNKIVSLSIPKSFRDLGLKPKLLSLFEKKDPSQRRLSDI